ncbi:IS4 transposase [Puniceicoccus vermicola]
MGLDGMVVAVDSSTIDLCLTLFPWADFRSTKAAVKIHTQFELQGSIPLFIDVTKGREHDVSFLDRMPVSPGTIYVMDRGYLDFGRLFGLSQAGAFFVIRAKRNLDCYVRESRRVAKITGLRSDQTIGLSGALSKERYPIALRRVRFFDEETGKDLVFLSNNFSIPALTVALVYKSRWQIELFFKWIKQNLRIKSFFGTSDNAVRTQIWIAICTYLLVASLKKTLCLDHSLTRILQVLSVNAFQKVHINQLFTESFTNFDETQLSNQLNFNDFLTGQ